MDNLYKLLETIKKAPSMYLGRHSIICLQAFLSGYNVAKHLLKKEDTLQDREFQKFPEWIRKKFKIETSQSWANIIMFYSEDESKALDLFFELFDEFLKSRSSVNENNNSLEEKPSIFKPLSNAMLK